MKKKHLKQQAKEWEFSANYWHKRCCNAELELLDYTSYWDTLSIDSIICHNAIDAHLKELVDIFYPDYFDSLKGE